MSESLEISSIKELQIMQDSVENLTICKKLYGNYYNEVGVGTSETLRNLLREELIEIDKNLRQNFYFIDFCNEYNDDEIIGAYNYFFHILGRFFGKQDLIIILKPEIPPFIKTQEVISPNQLYEKFYGTDARGLVSVQMLAGLNIFLGGDPEKSQKTMTEFLHNMSVQALSKSNVKILLEFDKIVDLVTNLIGLFRQQNIGFL